MASVTDPDIHTFLMAGARTGKLGFLAGDGRPLIAPIWFTVEGGVVIFNTGPDTAKGRAIARDPRVTLCVDLEEPPYGFVQIQGIATSSEDPDELLRVATEIGGRYMGADRAAEFGTRNAVPGELLGTITPNKVIASLDMTA